MENKLKKVLYLLLCILCLTGCSQYNELADDLTTYEKEDIKCVEGNKIWIYKIGKSNSSSITSQIIGECE